MPYLQINNNEEITSCTSANPRLEKRHMSVSVYVNKQPINDLEYEQNLLNHRYDEMVRSLAEQFHQKL